MTAQILKAGPRIGLALMATPDGRLVVMYGSPESAPMKDAAASGAKVRSVPCPMRNSLAYMTWLRSN